MMFRLTTIIALVGFVSANSYSIGCMSTLMSVARNHEIAKCLAPNLLLPILIGAGNGPDSVTGPLNAWLSGMCGQPACSDHALAGLVSNVTAGCSAEWALPGVQTTVNVVKQSYTTFRNVVCLKDGGTNCVTQTLKNVEAVVGTMNLSDSNVAAITNGFQKGFPSSVVCTSCMKGAYTIINQTNPGALPDAAKAYATNTCGASFANGGIPPGLVQSAYNSPKPTPSSVPSSKATPSKFGNGALSGRSSAPFLNLAVSGLAVVFTGMTML